MHIMQPVCKHVRSPPTCPGTSYHNLICTAASSTINKVLPGLLPVSADYNNNHNSHAILWLHTIIRIIIEMLPVAADYDVTGRTFPTGHMRVMPHTDMSALTLLFQRCGKPPRRFCAYTWHPVL